MSQEVLKGSSSTAMDKQGKVRIPADFRKSIEETYGKDVFVTTLDRKTVSIYPLEEWDKIQTKVRETFRNSPEFAEFYRLVHSIGTLEEIDRRGKVPINKSLRKAIRLDGEIAIRWEEDHLVLSAK
jgi:MraZ protein